MERSTCSTIATLLLINFITCNCQTAAPATAAASGSILNRFNSDTIVNDEYHYIKPGITTAQLLRARGYSAEEFQIITRDNYILSIVRATNPLISESQVNSKYPILFINPSLLGSKVYLINSEGVRPRAYNCTTRADMSKLSLDQLLELVGDDPAQNSLAFIAMNCGYPVWLVDRRGFGKSRGLANRRNRTLADAWASVPESLLTNSLGGFSLDANLPFGRPNRIPAPQRASVTNDTSSRPSQSVANDTSSQDTNYNTSASQFPPLPFSLGQSGGLNTLWQQVFALGNVPNTLENPAKIERDFIDTFDPDYWDFSFDEQADIDFPAIIDFVLNKTGKPKLHAVGFSSGGAVILLGLAAHPELANKISRAILWAPALNLGSKSDIDYQASFIAPPLQSYQGPVPFLFQVVPLQASLQVICGTELAQATICEAIVDLISGFSGGQSPVRPWFIAEVLQSTGSGEAFHLAQFTRFDVPCKYNYNTEAKNREKYGQARPPCYDLGQIKLANMSFYVGGTDTLVSPSSVATTVSQLGVPAEVHYIRGNGLYFNHAGFIIHKQTNRLAILPSLLDIELSQTQENALAN